MPRHTQPREVAEAKGAVRHNPQRYRNTPPKAAFALGEPPAHMGDAAKAVWFELDTYAAKGVLTCADRLLLEVAANLIAEYRMSPRDFVTARVGQLISCLGRLGMTPADRQKLSVPDAEKTNPFDNF
jgi:hypothetical protein